MIFFAPGTIGAYIVFGRFGDFCQHSPPSAVQFGKHGQGRFSTIPALDYQFRLFDRSADRFCPDFQFLAIDNFNVAGRQFETASANKAARR